MDRDLGVISVATACAEKWEAMSGDAHVRHCGSCDKNVYSLDALTVDEVRSLLIQNEGKICWRFFVRRDGTVLTKDCPVGLKRVRLRIRAAMAAAAAIFLASAAALLRESGFWGASQCLGSLSVRAEESARPPPVLRSSAEPNTIRLGDSMVRQTDE